VNPLKAASLVGHADSEGLRPPLGEWSCQNVSGLPLIPLEMLAAGEEGRIQELDGSPEFVHRLEEMGLRIGATVHMVRPGSPCIVAVENHRFSLRIEDSATVLIEVRA
jgi:ferrous iron transport protein A